MLVRGQCVEVIGHLRSERSLALLANAQYMMGLAYCLIDEISKYGKKLGDEMKLPSASPRRWLGALLPYLAS